MSTSRTRVDDAVLRRYVGIGLLFFAMGWLLYRVRGTLPIFLLGFFIAYALNPLLHWLEARGLKRSESVQLVFLFFVVALLVVGFVVVPFVVGQIEDFTRYYRETYRPAIAEWTKHWEERVAELTPDRLKPLVFENADSLSVASVLPDSLRADSVAAGVAPAPSVQPRLRPLIADRVIRLRDRVLPRIAQTVAGWAQRSVGSLVLLFLLPVIAFYFMNEFDPLRRRILYMIPEDHRARVIVLAGDVNRTLSRYFRGQILIAVLFSLASMLVLSLWGLIFGMRFTFVLGLLGGVMYMIPFIGMAVNIVLSGTIALLTASNPVLCAILAAGTFIVLNFYFDNLVVPRLMGRTLGLHPLVVIFALLAGAEFGGVLGMVVAVPVAGSLKAVFSNLFPRLTEPVSPEVAALVPEVPGRGRRGRRGRVAKRS